MLNLIYSKLSGEGFEDLASGKVDPDFGVWEIGYLLRDFTRLADTDQTLALTAMAHLCFLLSFLLSAQPASWPPAGLVRARWPHREAVKAYRARVRDHREQGQSFEQAQRSALTPCALPIAGPLPDTCPLPPTDLLAALLAHPDFQEGLRCGQENFFDSYEEAPLTEEEIIEEVEGNLSRGVLEAGKTCHQMHGWEPFSSLYNLGFVLGTINQGLTYAH